MRVTTVKVPVEVRDRLATVAAADFSGAPLGQVIDVLIAEHEDRRLRNDIVGAYQRLQADPEAWSDYTRDLDEWDVTTADSTENR